MDLNEQWFVLLGALLAGYAVLDGFDLGVGVLHLFVRGDTERRWVLNSIGPIYDGNEVWLVVFGGALFAVFPRAYAALLSGFYLPFMLLLFCLIGRVVSIEFRSKTESKFWRGYWDFSFALSSTLAVFVMGMAVGHAMRGMPVDVRGDVFVPLADVFTPYALCVGVLAVCTSAMHGAFYLAFKLDEPLAARVRRWGWRCFALFLLAYLAVTGFTLSAVPHAIDNFHRWPAAWIIVALNVLAVANIPRALFWGKPMAAFFSSCAVIVALTFMLGMAIYPNLLVSTGPGPSLDIFNAASSQSTLALTRTIALFGMPVVLCYTAIAYWVFRGKVKLDKSSY